MLTAESDGLRQATKPTYAAAIFRGGKVFDREFMIPNDPEIAARLLYMLCSVTHFQSEFAAAGAR